MPPPATQEIDLGRRYGARFKDVRERYRQHLGDITRTGGRVAVFGAGHLAAKFLNLFGLREFIDCVIDDNPNKVGLQMPGSRLPIRASSVLTDERIDLCLVSLSPESERKVIAAKQSYVAGGGRFRSIFAESPLALGV